MKPRVLLHDIVGDGEPLVLVPGGLTGWVSWEPHQRRLGVDRSAIRVQPIHNELGSAGLPGQPGYSAEVARESLRLTLDALDINAADLAGWSAGGEALIDFAVAHPDRVRSLTLVEPASYWILDEMGEADRRLTDFIAYLESLTGKTITEDDLAVFLVHAGFIEDLSQARTHPYWERALPHRMTLSWLSRELMRSRHTLDDLNAIDCPVLVTKGTTTEDWEKRVVDILGHRLPDARVVELEGSHAHHIESIDAFIEELNIHLRTGQAA